MLQRLHRRLGTAGLAVAVIALIAALGGTALAASGALTGKQKKEVQKIAKQYAGKPGAPGAAGTNGTNGTNGKDGSNGAPGAPGKAGESVTLGVAAGCGAPGGTKVSVGATSKEVCNGKPGDAGTSGESPIGTPFSGEDEPAGNPCGGAGGVNYIVEGAESPVCNGSPWTVGGTLPPGATETGYWAFSGTEAEKAPEFEFGNILTAISFAVAFPYSITASHTHYGSAEEGGAFSLDGACPGVSAFSPKALPGELCVYATEGANATFGGIHRIPGDGGGASRAGAVLEFIPTGGPNGVSVGAGSFAVTSCVEKIVDGLHARECEAP
jgi:hypothetical protein